MDPEETTTTTAVEQPTTTTQAEPTTTVVEVTTTVAPTTTAPEPTTTAPGPTAPSITVTWVDEAPSTTVAAVIVGTATKGPRLSSRDHPEVTTTVGVAQPVLAQRVLPNTGTDTMLLLLAGALLIVVGAIALRKSRKVESKV